LLGDLVEVDGEDAAVDQDKVVCLNGLNEVLG
jgi:hypothetical protein